MARISTPLLACALLALLGSTAFAQSRSGRVFARYNKPLRSATLDLATGTLERGPAVRARGAPTVTDFSNNDLAGFVGVDSGNGFCEWFNAGVKGTGVGATAGVVNDSDLMSSIVFAYCSARLTPASGGPGGSVRLGFYEGYTTWGGASTTAVSVFTLTGLPANSASSSFFGGFRCLFMRVIFGSLVCFADGPIGYSWRFLDLGTGTLNPLGATLAGTWPFLACVASCSATSCATVDGQGMTNHIDEYCPPGNLLGPFCFGTSSGSFNSISMAIEEVVDKTATSMAFNSATFPNPDVLSGAPVIVGAPWSATLTLGLGRTKGASWVLLFGTTKFNPPNGLPISTLTSGLNFGTSKSGRMLLCALNPSGFSCVGSHTGVSGSLSTAACGAIPKTLALVCNGWCGQAVVLGAITGGGGNARLSSGLTGTIGTF